MNWLGKVSVWLVLVALVWTHLNDVVQTVLLDAGLLSRKIDSVADVCELKMLPVWAGNVIGCSPDAVATAATTTDHNAAKKRAKPKPKVSLGGAVLKKIQFETRERSWSEKLTDGVNSAFARLQRWVLPESLVVPCLLGDCDMNERIKRERAEYVRLMSGKAAGGEASPKSDTDENRPPVPDLD